MKKLIIVGACAFALSVAGCASIENLEANLSSPNAIAAAATLNKLATAFVCAIDSATLETQAVLQAEGANKAAIIAGKFVTATAALCTWLGGTPAGTVPVTQ